MDFKVIGNGKEGFLLIATKNIYSRFFFIFRCRLEQAWTSRLVEGFFLVLLFNCLQKCLLIFLSSFFSMPDLNKYRLQGNWSWKRGIFTICCKKCLLMFLSLFFRVPDLNKHRLQGNLELGRGFLY